MKNNNEWSEVECKLLQEYYYTLSHSTFIEFLPDRTISEIAKQVAILEKQNIKFAKLA